jgi:hypothetical protein
MGINWEITNDDARIVLDIVQRAFELRLITPSEKRTTSMDITACHCNGCPLDLAGLLATDPGNFAHDVRGIIQHIDRNTGELMDFFTPRYAAKYSQANEGEVCAVAQKNELYVTNVEQEAYDMGGQLTLAQVRSHVSCRTTNAGSPYWVVIVDADEAWQRGLKIREQMFKQWNAAGGAQ